MLPSIMLPALAATLAACAGAAPPALSSATAPAHSIRAGTQTLLKFKDPATRVDFALLTRLGHATGAHIVYLRPMSDGAHVVLITSPGGDRYEQILTRLRAEPAIEYAEPDAVMRIQR